MHRASLDSSSLKMTAVIEKSSLCCLILISPGGGEMKKVLYLTGVPRTANRNVGQCYGRKGPIIRHRLQDASHDTENTTLKSLKTKLAFSRTHSTIRPQPSSSPLFCSSSPQHSRQRSRLADKQDRFRSSSSPKS